jgi:hypothetical protein
VNQVEFSEYLLFKTYLYINFWVPSAWAMYMWVVLKTGMT